MKCLSLWQPWASLIASGAKRIETRSWPTKHRGELLIHASKRWGTAEIYQAAQFGFTPSGLAQLCVSCGHIIATVLLADCFPTDDIPEKYVPLLTERERAFGNFLPGRFGWVLEDVRPLAKPIPFKGRQGLFAVPTSLLKTLEQSA